MDEHELCMQAERHTSYFTGMRGIENERFYGGVYHFRP